MKAMPHKKTALPWLKSSAAQNNHHLNRIKRTPILAVLLAVAARTISDTAARISVVVKPHYQHFYDIDPGYFHHSEKYSEPRSDGSTYVNLVIWYCRAMEHSIQLLLSKNIITKQDILSSF